MEKFHQLDLWLIRRVYEHKILGPYTKSIIKEMLDNNQIQENDEVCQGNGHWFKISEKQYFENYLINDIQMPYHPCSIVTDSRDNIILDAIESIPTLEKIKDKDKDGKTILLPSAKDLEFPDKKI